MMYMNIDLCFCETVPLRLFKMVKFSPLCISCLRIADLLSEFPKTENNFFERIEMGKFITFGAFEAGS